MFRRESLHRWSLLLLAFPLCAAGCASFRFAGHQSRLNAEAGQLTRAARNAISRGSTRLARNLLDRSLECCPDDPQSILMLAETDLAHGDHQRAVTSLTRMARQHPDRADVCLKLAEAHHKAGNRELAREHAGRACRLDPHNPAVWRLRGDIDLAAGQTAAALSHYQRAATLPGADTGLLLQVAACHEQLEQPERAIAVLDHLRATLRPEDVPCPVLFHEGRLLARLGQYRRAGELLREAASHRDATPDMAAALAGVLVQDHRKTEARQTLAHAQQRWPGAAELERLRADLENGSAPGAVAVNPEIRQNR